MITMKASHLGIFLFLFVTGWILLFVVVLSGIVPEGFFEFSLIIVCFFFIYMGLPTIFMLIFALGSPLVARLTGVASAAASGTNDRSGAGLQVIALSVLLTLGAVALLSSTRQLFLVTAVLLVVLLTLDWIVIPWMAGWLVARVRLGRIEAAAIFGTVGFVRTLTQALLISALLTLLLVVSFWVVPTLVGLKASSSTVRTTLERMDELRGWIHE
jgi:hypothetical protein